MKKILGILLVGILGLFLGCSKDVNKDKTIKVGASPQPHAEILEVVKPLLKAKGYDLIIVPFSDYITPNLALADGSIDADFFQHLPYLEKFNQDKKLDLISIGAVSLEPLGIYSDKIKSIEELKEGDIITLPNDPSNLARALILLNDLGVIKLKDPKNLLAGLRDIVSNPKKIKLLPLESAILPKNYTEKKITAAIINGNYALQNHLSEPIAREGNQSPYANIVAIKRGNENEPKLKALAEALQSQEVKDFITQKYKGAVVPAF